VVEASINLHRVAFDDLAAHRESLGHSCPTRWAQHDRQRVHVSGPRALATDLRGTTFICESLSRFPTAPERQHNAQPQTNQRQCDGSGVAFTATSWSGFRIVVDILLVISTSSLNWKPGTSPLGFTKIFSIWKTVCPVPGGLNGTPKNVFRIRVKFEACSSFTRVTACKIARPPKGGLLSRGFDLASHPTEPLGSYHVLPTSTWVDPPSTGDLRHWDAPLTTGGLVCLGPQTNRRGPPVSRNSIDNLRQWSELKI
jgi:hypothetical protein